jgi:hypothetical protein
LTSDTKGNAISQNAKRSIKLNNVKREVTILNNAPKSIYYHFYIEAETSGGVKAYKKVLLSYKANKPPEFAVKKFAKQVVKIDDSSTGEVFKYSSPNAKDFEKDSIVMKFTGFNLKCRCVKMIQRNNKFVIRVNTKKIKKEHAGTFKIGVELKNKNAITSNKYSIDLQIVWAKTAVTTTSKNSTATAASSNSTTAANSTTGSV